MPTVARPRVPWLSLARRVLPVTAVELCHGWTLWLFLSWIPSFFFQNFHLNLKNSAPVSAGVFLSGVIGDTLGGIVSDRILKRTFALRHARVAGSSREASSAASFWQVPVILVHEVTAVGRPVIGVLLRRVGRGPDLGVRMDIAPRMPARLAAS